MAVTYRRGDRSARGRRKSAKPDARALARRDVTRDEALRRIAAAVSGRTDLAALFDDVIDFTASLFSVERAALWLIDETSVHPFQLAAQRGLSPMIRQAVSGLTMSSSATGVQVVRDRRLRVLQDAGVAAGAIEMRTAYAADGIQTVCFVPVVFRDRIVGLLVLYHETRREWPAEELELAAAFADQMASAIENARLYEATVDLAARLRAIQDLGARLNRIQDVQGIAAAIVAEARSLIDHDNIRVYRVDHATQTCEPIAFQGVFMGVEDVSIDLLRCKVGEGLTGWVAEHNEALVIGDAEDRSPAGPDRPDRRTRVDAPRPDGVRRPGRRGHRRWPSSAATASRPGHEATLSIFAGHAAQAFVNADNAERVRRQQRELEHQLASQRRLLEVNETAAVDARPARPSSR